MEKSYLSQKMQINSWINPQQGDKLLAIKKSIRELKQQQSSPIPENKKLSHQQFQQIDLNADSSAMLNPFHSQTPNIQSYRFNQSYFTKQQLLEQENFDSMINEQEVYFGGIKNGLKHGLGVLITKSTIYQGQFSLNHKNGKGYIQYPNKSRYFGDFSNDKPHGHGMLQYGPEYYIGDFQNGMMHGDGLWKNSKSQKYIGKWKTNKAHGYGMYVTQKSHYQGEFNNFQKHGYGIENFTNQDLYKGNYLHGKPSGYGEYFWQNGVSYKGNFWEGLREGQGVWLNQLADQYQGTFKSDRKNGYGKYTWANGNIYKGQFSEDMRHGSGEMVWNDGSSYDGQWLRGLPNGKGLYKAKGQKPKYGFFQDNVLIQQLKQHSLQKPRKSNDNSNTKGTYSFQKSKLYLNMIPEYPKKRRLPQSRSFNRKGLSLNRTTTSTMGSFKVSTLKHPMSWRNK